MGSRYGGDYRRSGDLPYRDSPRWDRERFEREDRIRTNAPVIERDRYEYEQDRFSRGGGFEERYFAEERYGPPARRPERRYYEEDEYIESRRAPPADAMVPYRRREEAPPPRPGQLIRRQSSLDTFDRRPLRRFDDYDDYRAPPPTHIPVPPRRPTPPRYPAPPAPRFAERDYEEIRISEPDFYGDEEYHTYREREWSNRRARRRSNSSEVRERIVEEEIIEEQPWPRRGKTKMPRGKVHTRAITELGYPYEEEGNTVILLKALNKAQIDEVIALSQEYKRKEEVVTKTTTIHVLEPPPEREEVVERVEKVITVPMSEAPRSVREWDTLKVERRSPSPARTHRSRSHRRHSHSRHGSPPEYVIEKKQVIREVSPARTVRSRRTSSPGTYIEDRRIIEIEGDESNSIHAGPLALVVPERHRHRSDRDIKDEIRALEEERRVLRFERGHRDREIIIEKDRTEEVVEVRKDKKVSAPDPRLIRAMMATLT